MSQLKVGLAVFLSRSPALTDKLAKLGIHRTLDLVLHLPLRYQDETHLYPIADLLPGQRCRSRPRRPRQHRLQAAQDAERRKMTRRRRASCIRFLHFYPSQASCPAGRNLPLYRRSARRLSWAEMVHPRRFVKAGDDTPLARRSRRCTPPPQGLGQATLRKWSRARCKRRSKIPCPPPG